MALAGVIPVSTQLVLSQLVKIVVQDTDAIRAEVHISILQTNQEDPQRQQGWLNTFAVSGMINIAT